MEAPEKIYLKKNILDVLHDGWDALPSDVFTNIEYARTDAFIEKACTFLETYPHMFMGVLRSEMIEDFKNYMEE